MRGRQTWREGGEPWGGDGLTARENKLFSLDKTSTGSNSKLLQPTQHVLPQRVCGGGSSALGDIAIVRSPCQTPSQAGMDPEAL